MDLAAKLVAHSHMAKDDPPSGSPLLSLPAELRVLIFICLLSQVRCRRPIIVRDIVHIDEPTLESNVTAILRACRTTYHDCMPILYDKSVEISIRHNKDFTATPHLGLIKDCALLKRLRHIELEIVFDCYSIERMTNSITRTRELVDLLNESGQLKTIELFFYHQGSKYRREPRPGDVLLTVVEGLKYGKILSVSRNMGARESMTVRHWDSVRSMAENYDPNQEEQFQEISFDYWDKIN